MFSRQRNLWRINKFYKYFREWIENPKKRNSEQAEKIVESFLSITEVKEIMDLESIKGYKSYIVAVLTAAVVVAHSLGYIDSATRDTLLGLLGAGALGTVAAKINRVEKRVNEVEVEVISNEDNAVEREAHRGGTVRKVK